ncbi:HdeD family acid-resistance protein [Polycladidibacter hongkongensis]|uniref:HdeD family acid-resistance protein n=1 Tax=Polycladidibacter hongkongensis TaxID=1647556 RepID=UPI00082C3144|nr:HdeD family acid-resistance protein [Pseudovibrio hongkongensis]
MTASSAGSEEHIKVSSQVQQGWGKFLLLGILMIIGGMFVVAMPLASTFAVTFVIASCLIAVGVVQLWHAFSVKGWKGVVWQVLLGLIAIVGGALIFYHPVIGTVALTLVVASIFVAQGVSQLMLSFALRPRDGWGWVLFAGLVSLGAGICIFYGFPLSADWVLGTLAGISIIINGWSYLAIGIAGKAS